MSDKLDQILEVVQDLRSGQQRLELRIDNFEQNVNQRFKGVDQRLEGVNQRLEGVNQRLEGVDQRLEGVDQRLEGVDQRLNEISRDLRVVREQTARNAEIIPLVEDLNNRVNNHEVDIKLFKKLLTS